MNSRFVPGRDLCNQILTSRPNPDVMASVEPVGVNVPCVCDGSYACAATEHIHGCFSDNPCPHERRGAS